MTAQPPVFIERNGVLRTSRFTYLFAHYYYISAPQFTCQGSSLSKLRKEVMYLMNFVVHTSSRLIIKFTLQINDGVTGLDQFIYFQHFLISRKCIVFFILSIVRTIFVSLVKHIQLVANWDQFVWHLSVCPSVITHTFTWMFRRQHTCSVCSL